MAILLAHRSRVAVPFYDCFYSIVIAAVCAGVFGKLLFMIVEWDTVVMAIKTLGWKDGTKVVLSGGFVLYGGLFGVIIGLVFTSWQNKLDIRQLADALAPSLAMAIAFGRLGCLLGGCCYGRSYDGPFAITYPPGCPAPAGTPLFPSPIVESLSCLVLCACMLAHERKTGRIYSHMAVFFLLYSIGRFILEFMRGDAERGFMGPLSTSQVISLLVMGIWLVLYLMKSPVLRVGEGNE